VRRERGSVTAELAVALPVVVVLLLGVLALTVTSVARLQVADAARSAARSAALGEPDAVVRASAVRVGGPGVSVRVSRAGEWVDVTVSRSVGGGPFAPFVVDGTATAWVEP